MPETPTASRKRLQRIGLNDHDIQTLLNAEFHEVSEYDGAPRRGAIAFFDEVVPGRNPKTVVNWCQFLTQLTSTTKIHSLIGSLTNYWDSWRSVISRSKTFRSHRDGSEICSTKLLQWKSPVSHIVWSIRCILNHLGIVYDAKEILRSALGNHDSLESSLHCEAETKIPVEELCLLAIKALPSESDAVRQKRTGSINRLVAHVMRRSRGKVNASSVKTTLLKLLQ